MSHSDFIFKIGILGPTRVGKTSLIAAVLQNANDLLSGTPVSMEAHDGKTEKRLSQHHKELEGSIRAREFHPGSVSGTEESFTYELRLNPGVDDAAGIRFSVLDYPGGWIDPARRPAERAEEWKRCKQWIKESSVLLVPIESAVMMEAYTAAQKKHVPSILNTHDVASVARDWAKSRAQNRHEPALLVLAPVKCESYFNDNGGLLDNSDLLLRHVEDHYRDVMQIVRQEAPNVQILYTPVDTVGCCEIVKSHWNITDNEASFSANYRVRKPERQTIKGAEDVLVSMCRLMMDAGKKNEAAAAQEKGHAAQDARQEADQLSQAAARAVAYARQDEGMFGNFWLWLTNEREKREAEAEISKQQASERQSHAQSQHQAAQAQQKVVENFEDTISRLAKEPLGSRAQKL